MKGAVKIFFRINLQLSHPPSTPPPPHCACSSNFRQPWIQTYLYIPIMKSPNSIWKQAIPTMNIFFSVSINEILIRVYLYLILIEPYLQCPLTLFISGVISQQIKTKVSGKSQVLGTQPAKKLRKKVFSQRKSKRKTVKAHHEFLINWVAYLRGQWYTTDYWDAHSNPYILPRPLQLYLGLELPVLFLC